MENTADKKKAIEGKINNFVDAILTLAEKQEKLDYFTMEISNHQGQMEFKHTFKDREKAY